MGLAAMVEGAAAGPLVLDRLIDEMASDAEQIEPGADALERRAVSLVRNGDPSAYDYLVARYMKRVLSIAWGIVRNAADAEDLAQEAFVKAYEKIGSFREGEPFGPWVYRIVTNLALDLLKHRTKFRHEEITPSEPGARRDHADLRAVSGEIGERIDRAIESLPGMQRIVARLHLVEEFDHAAIAAMTGLAEGTVRSHLSLAKKKLREQLSDLYGGSHD
ncbi:MAG TPA: sigma-70 family RNA polymerase sigma factor [Thermoanaerobaculia bacterium]|nr:sigma-70 family RNA polymerase sigma factor [Thermoanaerobaculia bacterium]